MLSLTLQRSIRQGTRLRFRAARYRPSRAFAQVTNKSGYRNDENHAETPNTVKLLQNEMNRISTHSPSRTDSDMDDLAAQTTLAQELLSYKSLEEALHRRGESISAGDISKRIHQDLLYETLGVANVLCAHQLAVPINQHSTESVPKELSLGRQLASIVQTLILPAEEMIIPSHTLSPLLQLLIFAFSEMVKHPRLSWEDGELALDIWNKLRTVGLYDTSAGTHERRHQKSLLIILNYLLKIWSSIAGNSRNDSEANRAAVQQAEHILLESGQLRSGETEEQQRLHVTPNVISFNIVMSACSAYGEKNPKVAWASAERAEAILDLLFDLPYLQPTSISYDEVLKAWKHAAVTSPDAVDKAMQILHKINNAKGAAAPTTYTIVHICGVLIKARLTDNHAKIEELRQLALMWNVPLNTIAYNAMLSAYLTSSPTTASGRLERCEQMDRLFLEAQTSGMTEESSYGIMVRAWSECALEQPGDVAKGCAERAEGYLHDVINSGGRLKPVAFNDVLRAWIPFPDRAEALLEEMKRFGIANDDSYRIVMDSLQRSKNPERAEAYLREMEAFCQKKRILTPDNRIYTDLIMSWVETRNIDGVKRADDILRGLLQRYSNGLDRLRQDPHYKILERPTTTTFITVLSGYSRHGSLEDVERMESLLSTMEDMVLARAQAPQKLAKRLAYVESNVVAYNLMLNMYARQCGQDKSLVDKAETLLRRMESYITSESRPDDYSYSSILKTYAQANLPDSAKRASDLLERMKKDAPSALTIEVYNGLLNVVAKGPNNGKADILKVILLDMKAANIQPDRVSYGTIIAALTQMGTLDAIRQADALLCHFAEQTFSQSTQLTDSQLVDTDCYNLVLSALAKDPKAHRKGILELFQQMQDQVKAGNSNARPNTRSCNLAMTVMSPRAADDCLRHMLEHYQKGDLGCKPDRWSFAAALRRWCTLDSEEAASRAESILRLKDEFKAHDPNVFANAIDYQEVLKLWGRCNAPDAAERAEALLEEIYSKWKTGQGLSPNVSAYNAVFKIYTQKRDAESAERALGLLKRVETRWQEEDGTKPDRSWYGSCMKACAVKDIDDCDKHAEDLLNRYLRTFNTSEDNQELRDNTELRYDLVKMYNSLIRACTRKNASSEALERAIRVFSELMDSTQATPDGETFHYMFKVCEVLMQPEDPRREALILKLLEQCKAGGNMSRRVLDTFRKIVPNELARVSLGLEKSANPADLRMKDIPTAWKQNVWGFEQSEK